MSAVAAAHVPRETTRKAPTPVEVLDEILVELVDVGENVRKDVGDLTELKASIHESGLLQPILVTRQSDGRYRLIAGQRRLTASRELGRLRIKAIVRPPDVEVDEPGAKRSIEQLAENLIRKELNPIEEAVALREVLDGDPTLTQDELARRLGMSRPWVSNALRLLALAEPVQEQIRTGAVSATHGKLLAALPEKYQTQLAKRVVDAKISSSQLESEIRWKQQEADQDEARRKRTEKVTPKALEVLEKAAVPKTAALWVHGPYDINDGQVNSAIRAAGWKKAKPEYVYDAAEPTEQCTCEAYKVELGGRTPTVKRICRDRAHRPGEVDPHERWRAERAEAEAQEKARREAIRPALDAAALPPTLLRLLTWSLETWHQETWDQHVAHTDAEHLDELTQDLAQRTRDLDSAALAASLAAPEPAQEAATPGPKAKSKARIPQGFTAAQAAAALAEEAAR